MSLEMFQIVLLATFAVLLGIPALLTARICRRRGVPVAVSLLILVPGVNVAIFYWLAMAKAPDRAPSALWPREAVERREILRAIGLAPAALLSFKARAGVAAETDILTRDAMARIGRHHLAAHPLRIKDACVLARQMRGQDFAAWRNLAVIASRLDLDAGNTAILGGFVLPRGLLDVCAGWSTVSKEAGHAG